MAKDKKKPRKGFSRSNKEWEESIATHIGKFIDKLSVDDLFKLLGYGLSGYYGYKIGKEGGAATGIIGFKLATVPMSHVSNAAGIAILASIGLLASPIPGWLTDPAQGLIPTIVKEKGPLQWNWATMTWETIPSEEIGMAPY